MVLAVSPCDSLVMASPPLELKSENAEFKYQHSEVENYLRSGSYPEGADKRYKSGLCGGGRSFLSLKVATFTMLEGKTKRSLGL